MQKFSVFALVLKVRDHFSSKDYIISWGTNTDYPIYKTRTLPAVCTLSPGAPVNRTFEIQKY